MSTLQLHLDTGQAQQQLAALDRQIDGFKAKLASFPQAKALENALTRMSAFKGIEASAIQSLDSLARAMTQASAASGNLTNLSKSLNALSRVRVDSIANNLERVSNALAGLRVPPSVARFATDMQRIAQASGAANNGIRGVARALNLIKAAPGLSSTARSFERIGASATSAASGLTYFSRAGQTASGILSGFGVAIGAVGFANMITGAYNATRSIDSFKNAVAATQGGMQAANAEWAYVEGVASKLSLSIDGVAKSYGSFSAAAHLAGVSTADTHKIFEAMSEASRVLGLDASQVQNSFKALEQMFSKGTVNAEELKQQLGDALPGSMQMMAKAVGVSTSELMKMMQAGQVLASSALPKFADQLHAQFGAQVPAALGTASAAFQNFSNAIFKASAAFGGGLFNSLQGSINGLANTLRDPAFLAAAQTFGQTLGTAARFALQSIKLLADNFGVLQYAIYGVIGLKVGTIVGGWASSLFGLVNSAMTVTRTVAGMTVTLQGMGALSGLFTVLTTAMRGAATAAMLLVRGLGPVGIAITALSIAVPLLVDLYSRWTQSSNDVAGASNGTFAGANKVADAANNVATGAENGASGLSGLADRLLGVVAPANAATDALNQAARAAVNFVSVGSSAADLSSYMRGGSGVSVLSTPEQIDSYNAYAGGGIAGQPTGLKYRLPASAFINAPSFAGGGLSDGGIPAVLHPNEAVVPLTGGGEIPVANVSTGQASLLLLKPLNQLVDYTKQTKTEVSRVWEAVTNQTILMKGSLDRIEADLLHIDNTRLADIYNALATGFKALQSSLSSISVSGGGSYSSSSSSYSSSSIEQQISAQLERHIAELNLKATTAGGVGQTGGSEALVIVNGKVVAHGSQAYYQEVAKAEQAKAELIKAQIAAGMYSQKDLEKLLKTLSSATSIGGFATGSPNASKDVSSGGFTATLHPDEAVIPLPDGRSVPLDTSSLMARINAIVSAGDERLASSIKAQAEASANESRTANYNVALTMNVAAKDAASFNASKDQLMRDFGKAFNRATRRIGSASDIDDPTKRRA